jgi:hypothetical protein
MNTNSIPVNAVQAIAAAHGYDISGEELTAYIALGGAVVHVLHQLASAWSAVGGLNGFKLWFKTGKSTP